jgi:tetratricopeptide (TPR) repeat protein
MTREDAERAVQLAPRVSYTYNHRGILHSLRGEYDAAIADADKEIEFGGAASGYANRAIAQERKGNYAGAVTDWTEVIRRDPHNPIAYCSRGLSQEKIGKHAEAAADLRKGLQKREILNQIQRSIAEETLQKLESASKILAE